LPLVLGNLIGTDSTGNGKVGTQVGVEIRLQATGNTIGGPETGAANVISGSDGPGVEIKDAGTSGNLVLGNLIGTNRSGSAAIGNAVGVEIRTGATGNTVGGTVTGAANVISGNRLGVEIMDRGTSRNVVLGNLIGTDISGTAPLGNSTDGVLLRDGASANTIGGTTAGSGNTVAFNGRAGIVVRPNTPGNVIVGNKDHDNG
jgi:titin